jgi:hypothetical protein
MDEALNELKSLHEQIISILPKSLHEFDISKKSRIPFKVETLKGVLLHRISDLCSTSIGLIEEHKKLESILLIRAIQESVALLYLLYLEIKKTCDYCLDLN